MGRGPGDGGYIFPTRVTADRGVLVAERKGGGRVLEV